MNFWCFRLKTHQKIIQWHVAVDPTSFTSTMYTAITIWNIHIFLSQQFIARSNLLILLFLNLKLQLNSCKHTTWWFPTNNIFMTFSFGIVPLFILDYSLWLLLESTELLSVGYGHPWMEGFILTKHEECR